MPEKFQKFTYKDILLPKLIGACLSVYCALRFYEGLKGKDFSLYRKTIQKLCGVKDNRSISKAMLKMKRMGIIQYELKRKHQNDQKGRFIKNSCRSRYVNINILIDVLTVVHPMHDGPSCTECATVNRQASDARRLSQMEEPSCTECTTVNRRASDDTATTSVVAEQPASAYGETGAKAVPAVEKKKEITEDQKEREDLAVFMSGLHAGWEVAMPLPPHVGVASQPPPPVEVKQKFSKIDPADSIPGLSDLLTRIKISHVA